MSDETIKISAKSWARSVDSINKIVYSDGVVAGQAASFQSSFDVGYKQGFEFGFNLGVRSAVLNHRKQDEIFNLTDPRRINCQICINYDTTNENTVNLYNRQLEKNNEYSNTIK